MNAKISVFVVICVEAIIHLLLYILHDCTIKANGFPCFSQKIRVHFHFFFDEASNFRNRI